MGEEQELTDQELKALAESGKLMDYRDRLTPEEVMRAVKYIPRNDAPVGVPFGGGLARAVGNSIPSSIPGAGLASKAMEMPIKAGRWLGAGIGAKLGHPIAGYQAGKGLEGWLKGLLTKKAPVPTPAAPTKPWEQILNPPNVQKIAPKDAGFVETVGQVSKGVQNNFERGKRVTFERPATPPGAAQRTPRPESPPGATNRTSPDKWKALMDELVEKSYNDPKKVEEVRKLIASMMSRGGR